MTRHPPRSRRAGTIAAGIVVAALLASAAIDPSWSSNRPAPAPRPAVAQAVAASFTWSPDRVRELIAMVEQSRRDGFDPEDYGLSALRSELELAEELWHTPGSRQLDALARASALALAADYRRAGGGGISDLSSGLDAALATGSLRSWLIRNRASLRTASARKGIL